MHPDDHRLSLVRALLAKAEASEYPEEAEAFTAKASELIARYAIDDALLWAAGVSESDREQPTELRLVVLSPYRAQKAVLVDAVARAQGCRAVRLGARTGSDREEVSIVGFPGDLRRVETLLTSLLVQLTSAMLSGAPAGLSSSASAGWRRSFIVGFADSIRTRLESDRRDRSAATSRAGGSTSVALVLVERDEHVVGEFRRRFPHVRSSWASSGSSRSGADAGRRAGREASLSRGSVGGTRAIGSGG